MPALLNFKRTNSPWLTDLSARVHAPEIMDQSDLSDSEMIQTLRFLRITNQYFGGISVIIKHLCAFCYSLDKSRALRVLDIGTGLGDIPVAVARWAHASGRRIEIVGLELTGSIFRLASNHTKDFQNITIDEGDIFSNRYADGSFDVVMGSLLLHHLTDDGLGLIFKKADRLSRLGVIFSDLERTLVSYWAIKSLSRLIGNEVVRHDGPLSVRRAFRLEELNRAVRKGGYDYLKARREPFFRLSVAGIKERG